MSEFRRGLLALERGDYAEAVCLLDSYASQHPSDWRAILWQARARAEHGDVDEALSLLRITSARRSQSAVPPSFAALVLFDFRRFTDAREKARQASLLRHTALSEGIELLAGTWLGDPPAGALLRILQGANPDLKGRALHFAETRQLPVPEVVMRDVMDEVGVGWPGYRVPPPWLFALGPQRRVWRLLARGRVHDAFLAASSWVDGPGAEKRALTMIAAAMGAGKWDHALAWASLVPHYRAFTEGSPPRRGLTHFQVALFRGFCTLQRGDAQASLPDLAVASDLDGTSYLPRYFSGRAWISLGRWDRARREFVAACERLNPSLATLRWGELLRAV